jgi:hypothetical protein
MPTCVVCGKTKQQNEMAPGKACKSCYEDLRNKDATASTARPAKAQAK